MVPVRGGGGGGGAPVDGGSLVLWSWVEGDRTLQLCGECGVCVCMCVCVCVYVCVCVW